MQHSDFLWWLILIAIYLVGIYFFRRFDSIASNYLFYTNMGLNPDTNTLWRSIKHMKNKNQAIEVGAISINGLLKAIAAAFFAVSLIVLFMHYGLTLRFVFNGLFIALLILLACIDRHTYLLPDALVVPLIVIGLLHSITYMSLNGIYSSVLGFMAGYFILYVLNAIWFSIYRVNGFGAGDLKLLGGIGVWLGVSAIPLVLCIACISNAIFAMVEQSSFKPKGSYPFGPFIAIGAIVTLIYSKYVLI